MQIIDTLSVAHVVMVSLGLGNHFSFIYLIYRVQSKVVRRHFSHQPLVVYLYFQLQNWFKKCKDLCYRIFKFQKIRIQNFCVLPLSGAAVSFSVSGTIGLST